MLSDRTALRAATEGKKRTALLKGQRATRPLSRARRARDALLQSPRALLAAHLNCGEFLQDVESSTLSTQRAGRPLAFEPA